jgi:hypothetical protein
MRYLLIVFAIAVIMMTTAPTTYTPAATKSETDHVSNIRALDGRLEILRGSLGKWNAGYIIFMIVTAIAGLGTIVAQQAAIRKGEQITRLEGEREKEKSDQAALEITRVESQSKEDIEDARRESDIKTAALGKEAAQLRETAERERLARVQIEERIAWRTISPQQTDRLMALLNQYSEERVVVRFSTANPEVDSFSRKLINTLRHIGFSVESVPAGVYIPAHPVTGIAVKFGKNRGAVANEIGIAFMKAGISKHPLSAYPDPDDNLLEFEVGSKEDQ